MGPRFQDHRSHCDQIVRAVLEAADPAAAVRRNWQPLDPLPTLLVAIGKASRAMTTAALALADVPELAGIVTAPPQFASPLDPRVTVFPCDHPLPTDRNVLAARAVSDAVRTMHARHADRWQMLFLVSGGGSAHLTLPVDPLTVDDLRRLNFALQKSGATITELNAVRKRTEKLKGGKLGLLTHPAKVHQLVVSDVVGDALDVIASGPVVGDSSSVEQALTAMQVRLPGAGHGEHRAVLNLLTAIRDKHAADTPRPGDPGLAPANTTIICSNSAAVRAVRECAQSLRFAVAGVESGVTGEASGVATDLCSTPLPPPPSCRIVGGETTVNVGSFPGVGGPNQECALACAIGLERRFDTAGQLAVLLAFSTDGIDGPTDAAGAVITHGSCHAMRAAGTDPVRALAIHDSHRALDSIGALLRIGPTGTNVNHVLALLTYPPEL